MAKYFKEDFEHDMSEKAKKLRDFLKDQVPSRDVGAPRATPRHVVDHIKSESLLSIYYFYVFVPVTA